MSFQIKPIQSNMTQPQNNSSPSREGDSSSQEDKIRSLEESCFEYPKVRISFWA